MIETICIDASNKAPEIFPGEWITKGMKYHITHVFWHEKQGIQGCSLQEVRLTGRSLPYGAYRLNRFAFTQESLKALMQMMKDCSELNDFDVAKALQDCELVVKD